ncbi:MAG TPA: Zn-ribbon domain-containing OB-fold protein [Desulfobacterales bacterium]|nr:Zn-ribbon domain-containing OB-fold protein [Desulfobacterales bacterium]
MLDAQRILKTATKVKLDDIKSGKVLSVHDKPNLKYAWDNGVAIGRYLAELKNGRIIGKRCNSCKRVLVPPRMFCELCWRPTDDWEFVQDTGTILTCVVSHVNWDASRVKKGQRYHTPAVIELDGAGKDQAILHLIDEIEPYDIKIGMRVKAVWKEPEERIGAITDIKYFKVIG